MSYKYSIYSYETSHGNESYTDARLSYGEFHAATKKQIINT